MLCYVMLCYVMLCYVVMLCPHSTRQKFGVSSSQINGTLQNIASKDLATPEIEQSLVQARFLGQTQLERFVERRLLSAEREEEEEREREERAEENFLDPISKNNPPTFEVKSAATSSEKREILYAGRSILCRLVTAYDARREVNVQAIFQHALTHKNEPRHEKFKRPESVTVKGNAALFFDGFALVAAIGKSEKA